jgi:hypothetical protein
VYWYLPSPGYIKKINGIFMILEFQHKCLAKQKLSRIPIHTLLCKKFAEATMHYVHLFTRYEKGLAKEFKIK